MSTSSRLLSAGRPASVLLVVTVGLGLFASLVTVVQSKLVSRIVNAVFLNGSAASSLGDLFTACIGLFVLRALLTWLSEYSATQAAVRIKQSIRARLFRHLVVIGPAVLLEAGEEDEGRTGELVNTAVQGVETLEAYFSQYLPQVAISALIPLTILAFIAPLDPLSGIVLLLTAPLLPVFMYLIGNAARAQTRLQWLGLSRMSAYFLDVFQGLTTLKSLGRSREQAATIDRVSEDFRQATMRVLQVTFLSALALEMIATLSTAVVAVEIGLRLLYGRLAFEQAFFILLLAPEFYLPLRLLGLRFHAGIAGIEAAKRIFQLLDLPAPSTAACSPTTSASVNANSHIVPSIRFENVSFTYSDGRTGLQNASFEIPAGQVSVLVGESGAGKSTVISLLLRFLEPQSGTIWVDGVALNEIPRQNWYCRLAWAPQKPHLFQDSLSANLGLGATQASAEQIQSAARLAHAADFIQAFPEQYATRIGERGVRLSAGQAQRVALGRAFLQDAPLLLLDEPAAHLDPETNALLRDSLNKLVQGRTVLMISHQPPAFLNASQIIRLEQGRVQSVERPTFYSSAPVLKPVPVQSEHAPIQVGSLPASQPAGQEKTNIITRLTHLFRLFRILTPFAPRVALSVLLGFATIASSMGLMSTAAYLISRAALQPSIADLQVAIVGVRFFGLSRGVFRYLERLVSHDVTFRLLGRWRGWFYRAVEPLVPARTLHRHSGDLLQRAVGDITSLEDFYVRTVAPPVVALLTGVAASLLVAQLSRSIAVYLSFVLFLAGLVLPAAIYYLSQRTGSELVAQRSTLHTSIVDGIQGMPDLLASGQAKRHIEKVLVCSRSLGQIQSRMGMINGFQSAAGRLLADLGLIGVLWLGASQANQGNLEAVLLGALVLLAFTSFEAFLPLPQAAQHLSGSLTAAARLFEIADATPAVKESPQPLSPPARINLQISELSFTYPQTVGQETPESLSQISLSIPPGHKIALVGTSGAGKSTLMSLLLRFWEPCSGEIRLDGSSLKSYSGDDVRKTLAALPQNPALFSTTIRDNIRLAQPNASPDEIEQAARRACIHDWIMSLTDGYLTWVGEGGIKLSGGQRQRIALARTLLRESPLVILDEPTSHLDPATEQKVFRGILDTVQANDSSLLLITHRLVCMQQMDNILVLKDGRIIERGRHEELIALGGFYAQLYRLQASS